MTRSLSALFLAGLGLRSFWLVAAVFALCTSLIANPSHDTIPPPVSNGFTSITGDYRGVTLSDLLLIFQEKTDVRFYFEPELMPQYDVYLQFNDVPFFEALQRTLSGTSLFYSRLRENVLILAPQSKMNKAYAEQLVRDWESGKYKWPGSDIRQELSLEYGRPTPGNTQSYSFSGRITDETSGEGVIGATVIDANSRQGTATDEAGSFSLSLPAGEHQLEISYIGYRKIILDLSLYAEGEADIAMSPSPFNLDEVIIKAQADDSNVRETSIGIANLEVKTIKELPTFLGEADVIRSLESLAGVSTPGEGASGINVRGGNIDQNLVIQDGAPILNSSHALGFFSVFNPDVINGVALYKGSIPAQYGGRISSVVDVSLRDGDFQRFSGSGGVGLAVSRLTLEGPIVKNRTSFLVGGRVSYSDWMLSLVEDPNVRNSSVSFYDLTARLTHKFKEQNRLALSYFHTGDRFQYGRAFGFQWKNQSAVLTWNYLFSTTLSSELRVAAGRYRSSQFEVLGPAAAELFNGMDYLRLQENIFFQPRTEVKVNAGLEWTRYAPTPEKQAPYGEQSVVVEQEIAKDNGEELAPYLNVEVDFSKRLSLSAGMRYVFYRQLGPRTVFFYDENQARLVGNESDTIRYGSGRSIQTYGGFEPRLSAKYQLSASSSLKAGYSLLRQYIHLISNTAAATPVDLWQVSTVHIPPQRAHNFSVGYFQNFRKNLWQISLETYYKRMNNLVTYKEVPRLVLNPQLETQLLPARGRAYGIEFTVRKTSGKWSGQVAYTYARSELQAQHDFSFEAVNQGNWFPADFDQPHQIYLMLKRQINPIHSYSLQFTFRSGRPYTAPTANYQVDGIVISQYSPRNEERVADYHRLDLSYTVDNTDRKEKGFRTSYTFSFYNVYARRNAFTVFYQRNDRDQQASYQLSVLGTVFPAFSLNFEF